jgi:competence protein ComEA
MTNNVRILRSQDQATVVSMMVVALAVLFGSSAWDALVGRQIVNYEAANPRPIPFRVHLNAAGWPELSQLPGIGETLARRIVESRERDGAFRSIDELRRVQGVGSRTLSRIRKYLDIKLPPR